MRPAFEDYRPQSERPPLHPPQRARPRAAYAQQRPSRWGRRVVMGLLAATALLGGGTALLSYSFPSDIVRDHLVAAVKARTGRDLIIAGPATFSAVPSARVRLNDVELSPPPGMQTPATVKMKTLDVSVALWPLLWREVVVESIVLNEPVIDLTVDRDGRKSWDFSRPRASLTAPVKLAQAKSPVANDGQPDPGPSQPRDDSKFRPVSLHDLTIVNGALHYADRRRNLTRDATAVNAHLSLKSLEHPAEATGDLIYRGEPVTFTAEVGTIEAALDRKPARVTLKIAARPIAVAYEGSAVFGGEGAEGALTANAPDLGAAATWLGANLPADARLGTLDLSGQLRTGSDTHALKDATLTLNGTTATGDMSVDLRGAKPLVRGNLAFAELNLNKLLTPAVASTKAEQPPVSQDAAATAGHQAEQPSIEGLILRDGEAAPATRVKGYASRGGWSEDPISVAALTLADADIKISVDRLLYKNVKVGRSNLALTVTDSVLKADFTDLALYGGKGSGFVTVDGKSAKLPHVGVNLAFDGVAVGPLLRDAAELDWIEGQGRVTVAVAGSGAHQRAIIESLSGKAELNVAKGALVGIDVNKMARGIADGSIRSLKPAPGDKTAFAGLAGTWAIDGGVARNEDLRVSSDVVHVTGSGTVMLPDRSLDITIRPKLVAAREDEQGKGLAGIEVPVRVSGSWERPKYKADVGSAVQELGRRFKGKNTGEIVDELIGKDEKGQSKAKKLIDKLFR